MRFIASFPFREIMPFFAVVLQATTQLKQERREYDVEKEKKILRFLGSGFRYNKRLAIALAPGLLALLLHGGSP